MEAKVQAVIVDDEENSLEALAILLQKYCPDVQVAGAAQTVESAIELVNSVKPELLFLDIALPDGQGFEILDEVGFSDFEVIFTTAYDQYRFVSFN
ncbi:MAG: response regulator [Bacteroidales bacterium]